MKNGAVRWLIFADGRFVGAEYSSEKKAWRRAGEYAYRCMNQDDPYFPEMTVETERIDNRG